MVAVYCTPDDVWLFAQLRASNSGKVVWGTDPPVPDANDITALIESAEGIIDDITKQAFGTRYISKPNEIQDIHQSWRGCWNSYMFLNQQKIAAFSSVAGDKIEIFEDGVWTDYLTTYTEGRGDDFFVDYEVGKIYFRRNTPVGNQLARVTYRRNSGSTVPEAVREATALQVAIRLTASPGIQIVFPGGEGGAPSTSLVDGWKDEILDILAPHIIIQQPMNTAFTRI